MNGIIQALTPQALKFDVSMIQMGDVYGKILVVTDFPPSVGTAWLARITQIPGVIASIHVNPTSSIELVEEINRAIGEYNSRLSQGGNALIMQRTEQALKDAQELLKKIDQEQQNIFYMTVILLIISDDPEILKNKTRRVEAALAAAGMRGRTLLFRQEQGLLTAGPWAILEEGIKKTGGRNMPSETVAAAFPFVASGINDGNGIMLGRDRDGGLVLIDIWRKGGDRHNSNIAILGKSGSGKSFTAKMLLLREYMLGARIIIIDPEREYKQMCKMLGGSWVNVAGGRGKINPLHIRVVPETEEEEKEQEETKSYLRSYMQFLRTFFSLYLRDLSDTERALLEEAIIEVYKKRNIDFYTDIFSLSAEEFPTMGELYEEIKEKAEKNLEKYERLAILLKRAVEGADADIWNGTTTAVPEHDFIVLDVHELANADDSVRCAQYFNVLSYAWNIIERDRKEKVILMVDEAWMLVDEKTPQTLLFLRDVAKRIRKYEGCLIIASQNVVDFLDPAVSRFGQAVLDNPSYKILLNQGDKDLEVLTNLVRLTEAERELLSGAKRGEGLLVAGNQRIHIKIEASHHEMPYLVGGGS